jgi:uncharacterized protein YlzI (FlbEa/FlbD family)
VADTEKNAVIILDNGNPLYVQSTVKEIESKIEAEKANSLPVIKVADEHGREVWINGNHIIAFQEYVSDDMPPVGFA